MPYNQNDFSPRADKEVTSDNNVSFRENLQGTLLDSAVRTTTSQGTSSTQMNYFAKGVLIFVNVTSASGTGGLTPRIQAIDPASGSVTSITPAPTVITATGLHTYLLYPGATSSGIFDSVTSLVLPVSWRVIVTHGDSSNYTYSVGYSLML